MNDALIRDWTVETWEGYACRRGEVDGRACRLVLPHGWRADRRWAWRAEFFGAFANADAELLRRGYVLAYMDVQNHYGAPKAMRHFDAFYAFSRQFGLHARTAMIGLSRGGLFIYNWALENPDKVACLYADAPVCDLRTWPCRPAMAGSPDYRRCLEMYGLTEADLKDKYHPPAERAAELARAGIPVIHVCGGADEVVPVLPNSVALLTHYMQGGGNCRLIVKPGCGHHPHGLEDPTEIVEFIDHAFDGWAGR